MIKGMLCFWHTYIINSLWRDEIKNECMPHLTNIKRKDKIKLNLKTKLWEQVTDGWIIGRRGHIKLQVSMHVCMIRGF
jgi:hypothetical protein